MLLQFDGDVLVRDGIGGEVTSLTPNIEACFFTGNVDDHADELQVVFLSATLTGTAADTFTASGILGLWSSTTRAVTPTVWTYFGDVPYTMAMIAAARTAAARLQGVLR